MKLIKKMLTIAAVILVTGCATAPQNSAQTAGEVAAKMSGAGMAGGAASAASAMIQNPVLVSILMQQLGVNQVQAMGGAGSIFQVAQRMMAPSKFGVLSKAVPGMESLLASAPSSVAPNLMGGGLSGGNAIGNMITLANSFQSLGMGNGMVNQFIPVILQYLQNQGGSTAMGLLQGALVR